MYKGKVIYNPSGKAKEYSYWAANFYNGCSHGCTYCYLKKGRGKAIFGGDEPTLKKQLINSKKALEIFKVEAIKNISELKEHGLFFSFTTDPLLKETIELTILATEFCNHNDIPVKVLSKSHEGLTDKNGKEIYEGDIIQDNNGIGVIMWFQTSWGIASYAYGYDGLKSYTAVDSFYSKETKEWAVIGNIHDNPSLLK